MPEKGSLLEQYFELKNQRKDAILMFQVGHFFQIYYHDAALVAKEESLQLISRQVGGGKRIPMCGIPLNAGASHAQALADKGWRVVLCTQRDEKDEFGRTVRAVSQVVEPPEGTPVLDLTQAWDQYLENVPPEDVVICPPRKKPLRPKDPCGLTQMLRDLRLEDMTPMEAMKLLYDWKREFTEQPAAAD